MKFSGLKACLVSLLLAAGTVVLFQVYTGSEQRVEFEVRPGAPPTLPAAPQRNHSFCAFRRLSAEEAAEEDAILSAVAWPEAPPLAPPRTIKDSSDPARSSFVILPREGGGRWQVGDRLKVVINVCDYYGRAKQYGGDVLFARLHNRGLDAGVAGEVSDHLNGSYSVVFPLLWEGPAQVEVTLLHPSEAVALLQRLNDKEPDLVTYSAVFRSGSVTETSLCNVCLRPSRRPLCDYSDARTGEPWFCHKPKTLSCDHRVGHAKGPLNYNAFRDKTLFRKNVNLKVFVKASGPAEVMVSPRTEGEAEVDPRGPVPGAVGYYYRGLWQSLVGSPVRRFNTSAMTQCLSKKVVHMYGDSTIRQWFEYLKGVLPGLREFNLHNLAQSGPFLALDYEHNIKVTFRCHGPPIRFSVSPSEMRYIANELDGVPGGADTVVVVGIWSHYATFPIEVYTRRLLSIRRAVVRLLTRAPDTVVIFRTANLKSLALFEVLATSDWYSLQRDRVLRAVFRGVNVHLVDAWGMTVPHWLPHDVHPGPPIIRNMMDVILSYIC